MATVLGVDGDKLGWVGVVLVDGAFDRAVLAATLDELADEVPTAEVIGIDMPIGWCAGPRMADRLARRRLPGKTSSIFSAPVAAVRDADTYEEANRLSRAAIDKGLSRQSWALLPKIREATDLADRLRTRRKPNRVVEAHPELSFAELAGGKPVVASKYSWDGHRSRLALLQKAGISLPRDLGDAGRAGIPDVVDAAAVAWTASRVAASAALSIPDPRQGDVDGRPLAIWV